MQFLRSLYVMFMKPAVRSVRSRFLSIFACSTSFSSRLMAEILESEAIVGSLAAIRKCFGVGHLENLGGARVKNHFIVVSFFNESSIITCCSMSIGKNSDKLECCLVMSFMLLFIRDDVMYA
jgi:hypothetical protein